MTDERLGDELLTVVRRLPPGSGVVFRHYRTPAGERRKLYRQVARIAAGRRLVLIAAGDPTGGPADGRHGMSGRSSPATSAAHDRREAVHATQAGARVLFISPVFATHSHPDESTLGPTRACWIGANLGAAVIALGGMNERRFRRVRGFDGWAGIDAWRQKRKAVPT